VRIVVEASQDHGIETPRTFRLNVDRIEGVEVLDQWYGPDHRYCKVKGGDGALFILHLDESRSEWHLTMFASARAAGRAEVSLTLRQTELLHGRGREHKRDGH
jgi:hypothetical protein